MWYRATILSRRQLSPTVTGLTLEIIDPQPNNCGSNNNFTFLPGQWVDFKPLPSSSWKHPDGCNKTVGGYSLTSIPHSLPQIELAIQRSNYHPVTDWVTSHARPNDLVDVRVGGSFTYKSGADSVAESTGENEHQRVALPTTTDRLLFVAGGVGINPLFSMIQQWHYLDQPKKNKKNSRAILLYSGRAREEFLFVNQIDKLMKEKPDQLRVICTTTQGQQILDEVRDSSRENTGEGSGGSGIEFREGRINLEMIWDAVGWLNQSDNSAVTDEIEMPSHGGNIQDQEKNNTIADAVFVCGPPGMPESMMTILSEEKLVQSTNNVHFEKWW